MTFDLAQLGPTLPMLTVFCGGVILLLLEAFAGGRNRFYLMPLTVAVCAVAMLLELSDSAGTHVVFDGMLTIDRMSRVADLTFLSACALSAMLAAGYMREHRFEHGELYALMLFATGGMMMLGAATDLVTVFLGLETMSIAVYVLTGSWRRAPKSSEAAMKYFLNGAFAAAVLLYGIALVYGSAGSTSLQQIGNSAVRLSSSALFVIGMLFILVAFGFKIAMVPFHMWAPDTYEGAPTPVTAFMAAGVKAAAFVSVIRVFGGAFGKSELSFGGAGWANVLGFLAAVTMAWGNLAALKQDNIKRMLAYSSIAHAGYLLIGVCALAYSGNDARGALLFYLGAYTFTTVGSFGVVAWLGNRGDERLQLDDWAGLGSRHPAAALAMTVFMLSLGGIPPTAGFFGKFYLFRAALQTHGLTSLVIFGVINSVVSVAYYLRVITAMYFREVGREPQPVQSRAMWWALMLATFFTLALGIMPGGALEMIAAP